jgi:hypothetical protein
MIATVTPTTSSAAASHHAAVSPSLALLEARRARDGLATLLSHEHAAMAEFLVALADFDNRRGWEVLGHASLFAFLHVELKLPNPSAFWRMSAARLLQRFPDLAAPLRDGRLCCSATAELAKVLTEENRYEVLPRFFGRSAREAQEVVAELQPRQAPATRTVVTVPERVAAAPALSLGSAAARLVFSTAPLTLAPASGAGQHPNVVPPTQLRTSEVDYGGGARCAATRDDVEPITADLRRLHVTVSRQFLKKLDAARDGLGHTIPGAMAEQVLEAALDQLLEKQARARGLVRRPRTVVATAATAATEASVPNLTKPRHRRTEPRKHVPAAIFRAVWERDGGRCTWPLDGGSTCGSTHRLELDHLVPWARWGGETVDDLRVVCHAHNKLAARQVFGARCVERYARKRS